MSRIRPELRCNMLDRREQGGQGLEELPEPLTPVLHSKRKPLGSSSSSWVQH